ncbi:hypothetical protein F7725_020065 [Dissostichus mawsoni]|uniref:Uncharacterized protein n=1 Tax=Dissostichus mawsoni TaxID=36200 RepID=A0A7J5YLH8_DISMA|nr:hypothetical protein F7725_020065 [Dissostichus mawsoni]
METNSKRKERIKEKQKRQDGGRKHDEMVSQLLLLHAPQEVQCDVLKCLSAAPPLLFILTVQHLLIFPLTL